MKILKRCRCKRPGACGYDPTTCMICKGRIIKAVKAARQFDRDDGIVRCGYCGRDKSYCDCAERLQQDRNNAEPYGWWRPDNRV